MNLFQSFEDRSGNDSLLTVYIRFTHCDISVFSDLLSRLHKLHQAIVGIFNNTFTFPEFFKEEVKNILHIESIATGNSITIKIREGWSPAFQPDADDFLVDIPKALGVPALIASLLVSTIDKAVASSSNFLEGMKKVLEQQILGNPDCMAIFNALQQREIKEALDKETLSLVQAAKSIDALRSVSVNGVNILSFDVNRRKHRRYFINLPLRMMTRGNAVPATVLNISRGGCIAQLNESREMEFGRDCTLQFSKHELKPSEVSSWQDRGRSFVRAIFNPPVAEGTFKEILNG